MRMLITGATGFVGQAVVRAARHQGHQVVALTRSRRSAPADWSEPGPLQVAPVEIIENDLRRANTWVPGLGHLDAVVHLAAGKTGDYHEQFAGTVVATERLLAAFAPAQVARFVHVSSLALYDFARLPDGALLDESSPIITRASSRDDYSSTKLIQEELVREWAKASATELVVVRPGAIFGPGELWDAGIGELVPPVRFAMGSGVTRKFVFLDNCADALLLAAERPEAAGQTINVVDDDQPSQRDYSAALRRRQLPTPRAIPVPYRLMRATARLADLVNERRLRGRAHLPGILSVEKLESRFKPLRYDNSAAKRLLGWSQRVSLETALDRCADSAKR